MPDRYGEHDEPLADWERELSDSYAIARCEFCDDHGIRLNGLGRCDHIDYGAIAKRGKALCLQQLKKEQ